MISVIADYNSQLRIETTNTILPISLDLKFKIISQCLIYKIHRSHGELGNIILICFVDLDVHLTFLTKNVSKSVAISANTVNDWKLM